jgi:uncharacterized membrane protein YcgQ (UPF0703/DUF1980 family)
MEIRGEIMFNKEISKLKFSCLSYFVTSAFLVALFIQLHLLFMNEDYSIPVDGFSLDQCHRRRSDLF